MSLKKEIILWVKDVRRFTFTIPKNKNDRSAWQLIVSFWIISITSIIVAIILGRG